MRILAMLGMAAVAAGCGPRAPDRAEAPNPPVVSEGFATAPDSIRIYYRRVGNGPETVIIPNALYHGTRLDGLAGSRRTLVLYDPRGRGRSDSVPTAKTSLDLNLADVEALRLAVGADSIALIGWSGTGMEMFVYASRFPARVTRLVQLAPVAPRREPYTDSLISSRRARTDGPAFGRLQARIKAGEFAGNEAERCRAEALVLTPASFGDTSFVSQIPDVCQWTNEWPSRIGPYFGALLGSMGDFDWRPALTLVSLPRLVIHGELDNTPLAGNCEWVTGQRNARLLVIKGAGHWPHYERAEATLEAIRVFLDGGWPDAPADGTPGC